MSRRFRASVARRATSLFAVIAMLLLGLPSAAYAQDSLEAAKRWYESDVYQEAKRLRDGAARLNMVAVEGV